MNKFFKYFFVIILSSLVSSLFFIGGILMLISIVASSSGKEIKVENNSILHLDFKGQIVERTSEDPLTIVLSELSGTSSQIGLNNVLKSIKKATDDDRIKGIYLEAGMINTGYASIEEIRNALLEFKESGKFIYSFAPVYTQKAYYLASVADKIYLNPTGLLEFKGLSSTSVFFKGSLEKLGIEMQVFKYGEYKSAVEPFLLESMSEASRQQTETYLNSIWNHVLTQISISRGIDKGELNKTADLLPMFREDSVILNSGLIDGFRYKDEVIDELKLLTDTKPKDDIKAINLSSYSQVYVAGKKKGLEKNKIAIIYAQGEIDGGSSDGINSEDLSRTIRQARRDSTIKAIVLRINSPGGSGMGSEIIWREVKLARETKPFIVSMGDLAASGGYYIACEADTILAHPSTLTGSIGVFGLIPNTQGMLKKLGVTTDRVKTNKMADMPSLDRAFTSEEKELMQAYIERFYDVFLKRCADGRDTTKEQIAMVGEGRVWSGENAINNKLIDKLGGINDAVKIAANMANIETYRIVELPEMLSPIEQMMKNFGGDASARIGAIIFGDDFKIVKTINNLKTAYPIQTRMPFDISIN
jgi:protease IV